MENDLLEEISRSICANIDGGTACDDVCDVCRRQADEVFRFFLDLEIGVLELFFALIVCSPC